MSLDTLSDVLAQWLLRMTAFVMSFYIADKNVNTIPFKPSIPQRRVWRALEKHKKLIFLKGRQMWITTAVALFVLRLCWRKPGVNCAVALQSDTNAVLMQDFYLKLYRGNALLGDQMPIEAENGHQIKFANGSQILFNTANSEVLRSMPFNFVHGTECSIYDDLGVFLASVKVASEGWTVLETTANGDGDFYQMWIDKFTEFVRFFLCWRDHEEYRDSKPIDGPLQEFEREYIALHSLLIEQANWWVRYYRSLPSSKRHLALQEMPSTWQEAFIMSGDKYLKRSVPVVPQGMEKPIDALGVIRLHPFDPTHRYSAGGDMGEGSIDGDSSTCVILDLTLHAVAATMERTIPAPEHKEPLRWLLWEYGDPCTAMETAFGGLDICDYLRVERELVHPQTREKLKLPGVPMYQMMNYGGTAPEFLPRHGWKTDESSRPILFGGLYDASIGQNRWEIGCHRLVRQLNALCYRGKPLKPQAPKNQHDDIAVGFALAVQASAQARGPQKALPKKIVEESYLAKFMQQLKRPKAETGGGDSYDDAFLPQDRDFFK